MSYQAPKRSFVAGEYFHTSREEYSDYSVGEFFLVQKDLNLTELFKEFCVLRDDIAYNKNGTVNTYNTEFDIETAFYDFMEEAGYVQRLKFHEVHTGSYGDIEF